MGIASVTAQPADPVVLVIHGGAGTISRANVAPETEAAIRGVLEEALLAGYGVIQEGRRAMDGVVAAIEILEDSPHFNAGVGGVFAADGTVRHDASIMDGATGMAGASTGTLHVRHPIQLARAVMEHSVHVMLAGEGAEEFAIQEGLEIVPNTFFHTERRRLALEAAQARERELQGNAGYVPEQWQMTGTVGAVALDTEGHLAAGTSTGGMTNKKWGRIGDSPIIGAGTFANNATCGVSGTGHGEYFIRLAIAHDIHARSMYGGVTCSEAAEAVIHEALTNAGGTGGVIMLDHAGNVAMPFNTEGMYRGYITQSGAVTVKLYADQ